MVQDITQRKNNEEALLASERELQDYTAMLQRAAEAAQVITALSLSDKYARWRNYEAAPDGSGIYSLVCETNEPLCLTQAQLEAHPRFRKFGTHADWA